MVTKVMSRAPAGATTTEAPAHRDRNSQQPVAPPATGSPAPEGSAAAALAPLIRLLVGEAPVGFEFWDGSALGPPLAVGTLRVHSVAALRRILWAPGELGVARAFVSGDLTVDGDLAGTLAALRHGSKRDLRHMGLRSLPAALGAAGRLGAFGLPPAAPPEECRPAGRLHSKYRDAAVISHHYDVGNDFYRLVLGPCMTYSCARFVDDRATLEQAQAAKYELICRKLGLDRRPGSRLLDVGCGWGSMAIHAARHHRASVTGVTLSRPQADEARRRIAEEGLADRIEIRVQDYRDLGGEQFDAISSIGMFEHVGSRRMAEYFQTLRHLLVPTGRLLNHAISKPGGSFLGRHSFIGRYVFPDGELIDVAEVVRAMQAAGFEVRDVESLREHYARTLRHWVANLEGQWERAVALVGTNRANIWRLYMAASALGFDDGGIAIHQVLGVVPTADGASGMPPTRTDWG